MPICAVPGCSNITGSCNVEKKSFYQIPNPKLEQTRAARWIHNIGNADINVNSFVASKDKVVCSDHFHEDCIKRDLRFELMSGKNKSKKRRELVTGAVPTIFKHKTYDVINMDGTVVASKKSASRKRTLKLENNQVRRLESKSSSESVFQFSFFDFFFSIFWFVIIQTHNTRILKRNITYVCF